MISNCIRQTYSPVLKQLTKLYNPREFHTTCAQGMRFVQYYLVSESKYERVTRLGVQLENQKLIDLSDSLSRDNICTNLVEHLQLFETDFLTGITKSHIRSKDIVEVKEEFKLLAPITKPDKVICIGLNYREHCLETNIPIPVEPLVFSKFPSSIIGPNEKIPYPENVSDEVDWEVELAVIIGKEGKNIDVKEAKKHVFGYTIANDVTARDWQMRRNGGQWLLGKTMDGFCPLGPCIVTADEIGDPHNLNISCSVNGVVKQQSNTNQLVHNVYDCIAWISRFCTLLPGDVILTGTPSGVGFKATPPQFLKKGDVVECRIEKIGFIRNQVA